MPTGTPAGAPAQTVGHGNGVVTWPGGSNFSSLTNIVHGVGAGINSIQLTAGDPFTPGAFVLFYQNITATSFNVGAYALNWGAPGPTAGIQGGFSWAAY